MLTNLLEEHLSPYSCWDVVGQCRATQTLWTTPTPSDAKEEKKGAGWIEIKV